MVVSIIGSGPSGFEWFNTPCDLSIACNDAKKWGKDPDWLVIVNRSFPKDREAVIKATRAKKVFTSIKHWKDYFKNSEEIRMQQFSKHLKKGHIYSSKTSPFIALSMAFNAHATDIILFGVDLNSHPTIKGKLLNYELRQFEKFCTMLKGYGVNVWVISKESKLSSFLPVWSPVSNALSCPFFDGKFWYHFNQNQTSCPETEIHFKSLKIEQTESDGREWLNRTIKDYSVEVGDPEWDLGEMEVIKKDDKEIILKSTHSEFTATIDITSAKAIQEFSNLKIGDRFKAVATHY